MKHVLCAIGIAAGLAGPSAARADAATVTVTANAQLLTINQTGDPQICPDGAMTCASPLVGAEAKVFAATPANAATDLPTVFNGNGKLGACPTDKDGTCDIFNVPDANAYEVILQFQTEGMFV